MSAHNTILRLPVVFALCAGFFAVTSASVTALSVNGTPWVTDLTDRMYTTRDATASPRPTPSPADRETVKCKLKSIFISYNFGGMSVQQAIDVLQNESVRLDEPMHEGVVFTVAAAAARNAKPVSIDLENVPLSEALRYLCRMANVHFTVQEHGVMIESGATNEGAKK
jgi:hypothetical protein